jgi:hypothetical protein
MPAARRYLEGSWIATRARRLGRSAASGIRRSIGRSGAPAQWRALRGELYRFPLRAGGTALAAAVVTHAAVSAWLGRDVTWAGWMWRAVLLSVGLAGIASGIAWPSAKEKSWLMTRLERLG